MIYHHMDVIKHHHHSVHTYDERKQKILRMRENERSSKNYVIDDHIIRVSSSIFIINSSCRRADENEEGYKELSSTRYRHFHF